MTSGQIFKSRLIFRDLYFRELKSPEPRTAGLTPLLAPWYYPTP